MAWVAAAAIVAYMAPCKAAAPGAEKSKSAIAATVGDEPIFAAEVDELLADTPSARQATGEALARLKAEALEQLINRRLVFESLAKQGYQPPEEDVDELLAELKERLAAQQLAFEEFLQRHSLTEPLVRRRLAWDAAWTRYLEQTLTDEAVEKYFAAHRRDFDGTELRVSHILLRVENLADRSAVAAAIDRAKALRKEIAAGKLSFAQAAEKYSAGPSRKQGGDLGFIARHGQMAESFSAAAFQLEKGATSPPVVTPFGVHLIECTDVKPGKLTWQSQRRAVAEAWARDHFLQLAAAARKQAVVKFTGASPHFKPGTRELVAPQAN
jgi:peptidyl-prolyl cis-trans isomerase C